MQLSEKHSAKILFGMDEWWGAFGGGAVEGVGKEFCNSISSPVPSREGDESS